MEEMRLGYPVTCQKCGEKSFHPFYACQKDCALTISNAEKDQIHYNFEPTHVTCHELTKPCGNKKIRLLDLLDHLKNRHRVKNLTLYPEDGTDKFGVVYITLPADKLLDNEDFRWPSTTFVIDGQEFFFGAMLDPNEDNHRHGASVHFWIYVNGSEKMAKKFQYSVTVSSSKVDKKKWHWVRFVHSWSYYDFSKIRSRRETVTMPVKYLTPLCKEGKVDNRKYFNLEIRMFKNKNGIPTP